MVTQGKVMGHGLDIVDIVDFSRLFTEPAIEFLDRHFTDNELTAAGDGVTQVQRLAGRFAVKEAVMKALGVGWGNGITFTDVEVITVESGAPAVRLKRKLASLERERGIVGWFVSVSHTNAVAVASVIAISENY
jgi:holo-[acyl-carrier protein] synthase